MEKYPVYSVLASPTILLVLIIPKAAYNPLKIISRERQRRGKHPSRQFHHKLFQTSTQQRFTFWTCKFLPGRTAPNASPLSGSLPVGAPRAGGVTYHETSASRRVCPSRSFPLPTTSFWYVWKWYAKPPVVELNKSFSALIQFFFSLYLVSVFSS